jgi:putative ABC transport system substrate-binding protein
MNARLRTFIAMLAFGLLLAPLGSGAQQPAKIPRVGVLLPAGPPPLEAFRRGLGELGYIEGRNIVLESRMAQGQPDRLPDLAAELVRLKVDVIALFGAVTARAAKKTTTNIPIIFAMVVDPVADGVVPNLERPGGNVTGITSFDPRQPRKQLELLKEAIPGLARVALLGSEGYDFLMKAHEDAARALGLQPQGLKVAGPTPDLEGAFAAIRKERADAVLILEEPILAHRKRIAEMAATYRLPTMFPGDWADAGGLIAYGTSALDAARRMAGYVDKVLKGAKPGDLPVEVITRHELTINLKTAHEIGVTIPPEVLKRADHVIQ